MPRMTIATNPASTRNGSEVLPMSAARKFNAGVYRTCLYELLDERSATNTVLQDHNGDCEQCNWGLVAADGTEKPAFKAISNLYAILGKSATTVYAPSSLNYTLTGGSNVHHLCCRRHPASSI